MVVERNLASQGLSRQAMGREAFLEHVWEWKAQSGGAITRQLRRLGCSMDWSREQFTMDPHFVRAVNKVFVELYRQGLLYRDKRLVNWDPQFQSAISDLEVETREVQGKFWHLRYPLEDGSGFVHVATTRPETMLADMAVAVHPKDARYDGLVGKRVRLPITSRLIPIVRDEHADPELGSGAVKITPGHDFNDFEVGKRAGFKPADMLNMFDAQARVVQAADGMIPQELLGLDRFEARSRVVEMLDGQGLLERVEDRVIATPYGDRSGAVIEPWLTDQWYVDAQTLAKPAIEAVRSGAIKVVPKAGRRPGSTGSRISSPGPSRASSGGGTRSRPGSMMTATSSWRRLRRKPASKRGTGRCGAIRTCSTPGSHRPCGRSPLWAGPRRRSCSSAIIRTTF
jgi:valyl-tRNA synthetase